MENTELTAEERFAQRIRELIVSMRQPSVNFANLANYRHVVGQLRRALESASVGSEPTTLLYHTFACFPHDLSLNPEECNRIGLQVCNEASFTIVEAEMLRSRLPDDTEGARGYFVAPYRSG